MGGNEQCRIVLCPNVCIVTQPHWMPFSPLQKFVLEGSDFAKHSYLGLAIQAYLRWWNKNKRKDIILREQNKFKVVRRGLVVILWLELSSYRIVTVLKMNKAMSATIAIDIIRAVYTPSAVGYLEDLKVTRDRREHSSPMFNRTSAGTAA